ncbi:hypothetical protein ACQKIY_25250 [Bacillus mycoides]|uniref:hypothetical protein n=1 Tax=Bacillus mycoides TaxID=1405 RepID=UPI003D012208
MKTTVIILVEDLVEKKVETPTGLYASRVFETKSEMLIGNLKIASTIPNLMLAKKAFQMISDKVRRDLGIDNVLCFELSEDGTLAKVHVYDIEAEEGKAYIQKFDEEVGQFYIELAKEEPKRIYPEENVFVSEDRELISDAKLVAKLSELDDSPRVDYVRKQFHNAIRRSFGINNVIAVAPNEEGTEVQVIVFDVEATEDNQFTTGWDAEKQLPYIELN